ncbi:TPA: hypothetical protein JK826_000735 [Salmonella enterica]|nr:hypothetical protein [Salmonella enterica]HAV9258742.1 hypothetical protein [Salmonella enterica]
MSGTGISTDNTLVWCAEYYEWGNLSGEELGLYYNRHRYYEPLTGRYITQDPIGLKGDGTCTSIR